MELAEFDAAFKRTRLAGAACPNINQKKSIPTTAGTDQLVTLTLFTGCMYEAMTTLTHTSVSTLEYHAQEPCHLTKRLAPPQLYTQAECITVFITVRSTQISLLMLL